jgi:hypothetical protein
MWNFIIPAAIGAFTSAAMGKNPIQGAVLGGATGGLLGGMEGSLFNLGSNAATTAGAGAATSAGTAFGASQAPTALASGVGSGTASGGATSLLGSTTGNAIPAYDMGMQGVNANIGGFTAPVQSSQVLANEITPIRNSAGEIIGPDMSARQTFIDTTPSATNANFGTVDPNTLDYTQGQRVQDKFGYSDGVANKANLEIGPDMSQVTKPEARDLSKAGGYEKPLYERAYDSIIGAVKKDPLGTLGTGALVATSLNPKRPQPPITGSGGSITKGTPPQDVGQILKVRRPTRFA